MPADAPSVFFKSEQQGCLSNFAFCRNITTWSLYPTHSTVDISIYFLRLATGGSDNSPPGLYSWH